MHVSCDEQQWVSTTELRTRLLAGGQTIYGCIVVSGVCVCVCVCVCARARCTHTYTHREYVDICICMYIRLYV
jgi:hypothetical protein